MNLRSTLNHLKSKCYRRRKDILGFSRYLRPCKGSGRTWKRRQTFDSTMRYLAIARYILWDDLNNSATHLKAASLEVAENTFLLFLVSRRIPAKRGLQLVESRTIFLRTADTSWVYLETPSWKLGSFDRTCISFHDRLAITIPRAFYIILYVISIIYVFIISANWSTSAIAHWRI